MRIPLSAGMEPCSGIDAPGYRRKQQKKNTEKKTAGLQEGRTGGLAIVRSEEHVF